MFQPLDEADRELVARATQVIRDNYLARRHSVACALRGRSGRVHVGVNVDTCGFGPCAEPVALGSAVAAGERAFLTIVAVGGWDDRYEVLTPCGNCRQMMLDFMPVVMVIVPGEQADTPLRKVAAAELLPLPYRQFER